MLKEVTSKKRDFFNAFEVLYYSGTWPQLERWTGNETTEPVYKKSKSALEKMSPQSNDNIETLRAPGPSISKKPSRRSNELIEISPFDEITDDNHNLINEPRRMARKPELKNRNVRAANPESTKSNNNLENISQDDEVIEILDEMNEDEYRRPVVSYGIAPL